MARHAADRAQAAAPLAGWVNNAAVFRDVSLATASGREVFELVRLNLDLAVFGSATAVRRFLGARSGGAIVNVSSHQAQRAVRGALPYATAKAGIEGLTRALAVDHGPDGIRVNAVALGSNGPSATPRCSTRSLPGREPAQNARWLDSIRSVESGGQRRGRR